MSSPETRFTRRDFVKTGAVATAGFVTSANAVASLSTASPQSGPAIHLGVASYTFRGFKRAQVIGYLKQLGISDMNAKNVHDHLPMDPAAEAAALADYAAAGIRLHAAGNNSFAKHDEADFRAKFEYCKRAGLKVIVAGEPATTSLPLIEKLVQEYDIRFALHNHGPEDKLWHSPLDVLQAVKNMDPRMGCCFDLGHAARAGVDVVQTIHEVGPRVFNVHIKDLTDFSDDKYQTEVGRGKMPVKKIFEALLAIKYTGFVDLEYELNENNPIAGVIESLAYMRGVLAGMS